MNKLDQVLNGSALRVGECIKKMISSMDDTF